MVKTRPITQDMRLLGLDYGDKRVGLALAASFWPLVTPLKTLSYSKFSQLAEGLRQVIKDYEVEAVVIGYPLNADGSEGKRCQVTRDVVRQLQQNGVFPATMPLAFQDERRSSLAADSLGATKESRDALAAHIILEDFIAANRTHQ